MRGKGDFIRSMSDEDRITPAYAGKRRAQQTQFTVAKDHPRVCGEKELVSTGKEYCEGSPPRMRGKGPARPWARLAMRITPAYAGKSVPAVTLHGGVGDHPRVCGEKCSAASQGASRKGSPPRMRGKVVTSLIRQSPPGITPAYAGKRLNRSHTSVLFTCHLRPVHSVSHRLSE